MTFAQIAMSGSQQIVPQVVNTRSNGPGVKSGAKSTVPCTNSALRPVSSDKRLATSSAVLEKSSPVTVAPRQTEGISTNMALQMQHALSGNIAKFGCFYRVKRILARAKPAKHVVAGRILGVNCRALLPVQEVNIDMVAHKAHSDRWAAPRKRPRKVISSARSPRAMTMRAQIEVVKGSGSRVFRASRQMVFGFRARVLINA